LVSLRLSSLLEGISSKSKIQETTIFLEILQLQKDTYPLWLAGFPPKKLDHYATIKDYYKQESRGLVNIYPIFAFGKVYLVVARPGPAFLKTNPHQALLLTGSVGLLLSSFLTALVIALTNHQDALSRQVSLRTAQMQEMGEQMQERMKELNYLVQLAQIAQQENLSLGEFLEKCVDFIPFIWDNSQRLQAKIVLHGQSYFTPEFSPSSWRFSSDLVVNQRVVGLVQIHLHPLPTEEEKDFLLNNKLAWLETIAQFLSNFIEQDEAKKQLIQSEKRFRRISAIISDIAYSSKRSPEGNYAFDWITGAVEGMTGYTIREIKTHADWRFLILPEDLAIFEENVLRVQPGYSASSELRLQRKDGTIIWVTSYAECLSDANNSQIYLYGGLVNITERKEAESKIQFLAYYDSLTGLPNRRLFLDRLENTLSLAHRKNQYGAVMFIDLDRFKQINSLSNLI
jgi:PAS domain S-box-containing protein